MEIRLGVPDVLNVLAVTVKVNVLLGTRVKDDGDPEKVRDPGLGGGLLDEPPPPHAPKKNDMPSSGIMGHKTRNRKHRKTDTGTSLKRSSLHVVGSKESIRWDRSIRIFRCR